MSRKRYLIALTAITWFVIGVLIALVISVSGPAKAATQRYLWHDSDAGYDPAMIIECAGAEQNHSLFENESSMKYCADLARIYVRPTDQYYCEGSDGVWRTRWPAEGWHIVGDTIQGWHCVLRRVYAVRIKTYRVVRS